MQNLGYFPAQAWKTKKPPWKKLIFFPKMSHPKQVSYTFLKKLFILYVQPRVYKIKMFYNQIVFISSIPENFFLYSSSIVHGHIVHDRIDASFLSLLQKGFCIAQEHNGAFWLFLLRKDFCTFHVFPLKLFSVFLIILYEQFYI